MTEITAEVAVIGAGPAGLMAAEILSGAGLAVSIYDAMPSPARKFLMAGKSGLNITNTRQAEFLSYYPDASRRMDKALAAFGPDAIMDWMRGLGIEPVTGPTGRVFPSHMKASPLLRAWLARLRSRGVELRSRHRWSGWSEAGELLFETPGGVSTVKTGAQIFALGGGSWPRLGSDGAWQTLFRERGIATSPFRPSNCGFTVKWSDRMKDTFAGTPVKNVAVSFMGQQSREEFVVTAKGVESGAIFTLSLAIRDQLETGASGVIMVDLAPDLSHAMLLSRLTQGRGKQSLSNHLRKVANLKGVKRALLFEFGGLEVTEDMEQLAHLIKNLPIPLEAPFAIADAISTAGGVCSEALNEDFMVKGRPGIFCAGEMIDWDAPTGGYLLTACLATGRAAGRGALDWLGK